MLLGIDFRFVNRNLLRKEEFADLVWGGDKALCRRVARALHRCFCQPSATMGDVAQFEVMIRCPAPPLPRILPVGVNANATCSSE